MTLGKVYRRIIFLAACFSLFFGTFAYFEPVIAGAASFSDEVNISQSVSSEITISSPLDMVMSPSISGLTGGIGKGTVVWNVITNNISGFSFSLKSDTSPALQSGTYSFADYTKNGAVPDFAWSVNATDSEFGFTVETVVPTDLVSDFRDNGTICGSGVMDTTDSCWEGFSTVDKVVVNRSSQTDIVGEDIIVKFQDEAGADRFQEAGSYSALITATAVTN